MNASSESKTKAIARFVRRVGVLFGVGGCTTCVALGCAASDAESPKQLEMPGPDGARDGGSIDPPTIPFGSPDSDTGRHDTAVVFPDAGPGAPAAQLALGQAHTCARLIDGTVRCWGSNVAGDLGDGTTASRTFAYPIRYMNDVVEIAARSDGHRTCVRRSSGAILCWGELDDYAVDQCLLDAPPVWVGCVKSPMALPSPPSIVGVAVGKETCARFADGHAACLDSPTPPFDALVNVAQLALGGTFGCARIYDGTVRCWGDDALGELGAPATETCSSILGRNPCSSSPLTPSIAGVAQLSSGASHTCALHTDGTVECWGANDAGQLGFGALDLCTKWSYPCAMKPGKVVGLTGVAQIAAGGDHTCARLTDGTVRCWGSGGDGELGYFAEESCNGSAATPCSTRAKPIFGLDHVVEIALGSRHSCARIDTGEVKCWGWNGFGQLGDGTRTSRIKPVSAKL